MPKLTTAPNPSRIARPWTTSLEPWQIDALATLRDEYGVGDDAMVRAGLTLFLALVAAAPAIAGAVIGRTPAETAGHPGGRADRAAVEEP